MALVNSPSDAATIAAVLNRDAELLAELLAEVKLFHEIARSMPPPRLGEWDWPGIAERLARLVATAEGVGRE